jgi:hypothetical protein
MILALALAISFFTANLFASDREGLSSCCSRDDTCVIKRSRGLLLMVLLTGMSSVSGVELELLMVELLELEVDPLLPRAICMRS